MCLLNNVGLLMINKYAPAVIVSLVANFFVFFLFAFGLVSGSSNVDFATKYFVTILIAYAIYLVIFVFIFKKNISNSNWLVLFLISLPLCSVGIGVILSLVYYLIMFTGYGLYSVFKLVSP